MEILETFDKYLNVSREQAYNQFLDERNIKIFRVMLWIFAFFSALIFTINLSEKESFDISAALLLLNLIIIVSLIIVNKKLINLSNVRRFVFFFLIFQLFMYIAVDVFETEHSESTEQVSDNDSNKKNAKSDTVKKGPVKVTVGASSDDSFVKYIIFFGILILIFRFSRTEIVQLFSVGVGASLLSMLFYNSQFNASASLPNLITAFIFFVIAYTSDKKRQRKFFEQYDFYYKKNYENIRMKKELDYAREIQLSMLPENDAVIGDIEISAVSLPATEVGGDYFDYFKISDNEVGVFICDVSGHGVASGILLSGLRSCMHLILEDHSNPKVVMDKLNKMIRKTQSRKMFVTAIFAIIDMEKNKCMLYNAGHLPPYKISGESKEIFKIKKHGIALGAMNSVEKAGSENEVVFDFNKDDKLILYTDGVNEAMNSSKSEYGLDNLELYLNNNADKNTNDLLKGLLNDISKFTNNSPQRDDLSLLIIHRN